MKNRNKLRLIIATITVFTAGLTYGGLITTNYLAEDCQMREDSTATAANDTTLIAGTFSEKIQHILLKAANPDVPGGYEITNATLNVLQDVLRWRCIYGSLFDARYMG